MPNIQSRKFCCNTLNSFITQETNFEYEIIIGDDCSDDGTVEILKDFESKNKNIHVLFRKKKIGARSNWIETLSYCKGRYISYCDGDDFFTTPQRLQIFYNYMESNPSLFMSFGPAYRMHNDRVVSVRNKYKSSEIVKINLEWILKKGGGFYPTSSSFFKANLFLDKPEWFFMHATGDYPLAILAYLRGGLGYVNHITVCYRVHGNSMTNSVNSDSELCKEINTRKWLKNKIFFDLLHSNGIVNKRLKNTLIAKGDYIYYVKLANCGLFTDAFKGVYRIRHSLFYKTRLVVKILHILFKKSV